ncbi:insulinase family protein [Aquabacterium sp. A7-Y]|uniref:M16 family metallopeptidase n=1 Tax=Aquabacterium sp. A7-Y TaxID=1349605 RepID=UPI00223E4D56|nr:pitrilysin family protein [Aquabacterium sp. A7-Y]MCW7536872.1 insulinase family protein [Aquabacterium sp. A7-Y]
MTADPSPSLSDTFVATLGNGVRVLTLRLPHLHSASVSVFVRSGSQHESLQLNGISHLVEHMAFKGTHERDCQQINLDAERLGAEVNAHTDKDHTAYHMRGLAHDARRFVHMLGDIVRNGTFPEAELERERQVILQEYMEDDDDPLSTAFKLFDKICFGNHPVAQPIIGTRRNIERFTREDLVGYVQRQYTGANVIVGVAGPVDPDAILKDVEAAFGSMPAGSAHQVVPPDYVGGVRSRRLGGSSQSHLVLGYAIPTLKDDDPSSLLAAALFGEGMSSPLMDQIRERLGLVYHAACSADVMEVCGQFVIEASTVPEHVDQLLDKVMSLLAQHAETTDPVGLERARNQLAVRSLLAQERPYGRLETAAQDLFVHGRVRSQEELTERLQTVTPAQVREAFARMLASPVSVALAGKVGQQSSERVRDRVAAYRR